jgi:hypothetical protein
VKVGVGAIVAVDVGVGIVVGGKEELVEAVVRVAVGAAGVAGAGVAWQEARRMERMKSGVRRRMG